MTATVDPTVGVGETIKPPIAPALEELTVAVNAVPAVAPAVVVQPSRPLRSCEMPGVYGGDSKSIDKVAALAATDEVITKHANFNKVFMIG